MVVGYELKRDSSLHCQGTDSASSRDGWNCRGFGCHGSPLCGLWGDFPAPHHLVVFVCQVVAVSHVWAHEVTEVAADDY